MRGRVAGQVAEIGWSVPLIVVARAGVVLRGGARARDEIGRMVGEKVAVLPEMARAVAQASPAGSVAAAVRPVHRRVRANRRRLLGW
ncbi:hypothetical protein [Pseudonocardia sp. HH130630-07]|uniref:hypothetical protein n=1 Tax=Pseudonocardia sp. HH130630-07 TaxID=1690815 RepID=UPI0012E9F65A|nr:hypothetical protein [Pseudonocardia sp. HH130630-07]